MRREAGRRNRDACLKASGSAKNQIDVDHLLSFGPIGDPFKLVTKSPVLFSKASELGDGLDSLIIVCERTPQAACMGAWIAKVAQRCDITSMMTFYGAKELEIELDEPGSIVTVGIPLEQRFFIKDLGTSGWTLFACPTTKSFEAMKVISRGLGYRFHICSVPWARILLPRRHIPAPFYERRTGHAGFDAIVDAAGAAGDPHPVMRRKVRKWIGVRMCEPALSYLSELMSERDPHIARIQINLIESVR